MSTTPQIEGHTIREYKGIVTGETIIGANMFKDLFAGIRDIVGGRAGAYEKVLSEAKDTSMQEMMQRAQAMGANAIGCCSKRTPLRRCFSAWRSLALWFANVARRISASR